MTQDFSFGDFVKYKPDFGEAGKLTKECYVIGYAPDSFDAKNGVLLAVVASEGWFAHDITGEALELVSSGHTEVATRLRAKHRGFFNGHMLPLAK